jgi:hypothetical protein
MLQTGRTNWAFAGLASKIALLKLDFAIDNNSPSGRNLYHLLTCIHEKKQINIG